MRTTLPRLPRAAALLVALLTACAQDAADEPASPQSVAVDVAPAEARLDAGGTVQFGATVTGTADTTVTWEVVQAGGGTITAGGLYTAPVGAGTFTVRAVSRAAPAVSGSATVIVAAPPPPVTVAISPATTTIAASGTVTFTATVTNAASGAVTWAVQEPTGCGSITAAGVYTAPGAAATCHVVARSSADAAATATVTVTAPPPPVTVAISPASGAIAACRTLTFGATVANAGPGVTWSVQEGAAGGTITAAGVYTAPENAGTYHVVATSQATPTATQVATVTVTDLVLGVTVTPGTASVQTGGTQQFTATVTTSCGTFASTATVAANGTLVTAN